MKKNLIVKKNRGRVIPMNRAGRSRAEGQGTDRAFQERSGGSVRGESGSDTRRSSFLSLKTGNRGEAGEITIVPLTRGSSDRNTNGSFPGLQDNEGSDNRIRKSQKRMRSGSVALIILIFLTAAFLFSCRKDDPRPVENPGTLVVDIGLDIRVDELDSRLKASGAVEDFNVTVYRSDGTVEQTFETVSVMPDTVQLVPGDYYVEAHSNNDLPAAFDNPYYYGVSGVFTISSNAQESVTVTCTLANTMVSVIYSDNTINGFSDYTTTVSTELGSLIYIMDETRIGYFQPSPMDILVELISTNPDGTNNTTTLNGSIPDPQINTHYEVLVNVSSDQGSGSFQVLVDETAIPVEVVEINGEPAPPPAGTIAYGDLLITEIMSNPDALSDTEGEWFEIYNNSTETINLKDLVLARNGTDIHTISDSIDLVPGEYYVMARTVTASDAVNTYVYGSGILLPNTGAELAIHNEDTGSGPGALIFSVNYGDTDFPSGTGASICLNPNLLNASDAILGISWCVSTSVFNTGDSGTPGGMNDACL